jgi:hypothetical protein
MFKSAVLGLVVLAMLAHIRTASVIKGSIGLAQRLFSRGSNQKTRKLANPRTLLDKTDVFVFDCDGVLW